MAGTGNSCRTWQTILSKDLPKICGRNCFDLSCEPCPDYKIVDVSRNEKPEHPDNLKDSHVNFNEAINESAAAVPNEHPVRRLIDTKALCPCSQDYERPDESCTLSDAQNATHKNNFCALQCRPLRTNLHLKECTKRPRPKPTYKHSVILDHETIAGRAFPGKFQIRRLKNKCCDCSKELYFKDQITDNANVLLLQNCCDVKILNRKYIDNWHRVPILSLTGKDVMKKRTINEVCQLEQKKVPPPPPEVFKEKIPEPPPAKAKKGKGKKGKGKGKKK